MSRRGPIIVALALLPAVLSITGPAGLVGYAATALGSNTTEVFATVALRPYPVAMVRVGARRLRLSETADLWYIGRGAFEDETFGYTGRPSGSSRGLATILDLSLTVTSASWLTFEAFGALAPEDEVIRGIYPDAGAGSLGYLEVELRR